MQNSGLILDGIYAQKTLAVDLKKDFKLLDRTSKLAIVLVGDDARSRSYIEKKIRFGELLGVTVILKTVPVTISENDLVSEILSLNRDETINGIIVQLPLPGHLSRRRILDTVDPRKDVDGLHSLNFGKLALGDVTGFVPATARGIVSLLDFYAIPITSQNVVVIGRSELVGKPTALSLLHRNASVSILHSHTKDMKQYIDNASIVIVAVGHPHLFTGGVFGLQHSVIDVGTSVIEQDGRAVIVGDVDYKNVLPHVKAISPVPGGVGPMTVISLFQNLYDACIRYEAL